MFSSSAGPLGLLFEMGRGTQILWPHKNLYKKKEKEKEKEKRNVMFTTFSQQIKSDTLLQVIIGGQKGNFNSRFKLELIII